MTGLRAAGAAVVATAVLLVLQVTDGPVWLRTPLALVVFLTAPGLAVVPPARELTTVLRLALIVGLSLAVDVLAAVLLLQLDAFSAPAFLGGLLVLELAALVVHLRRRDRGGVPVAEVVA